MNYVSVYKNAMQQLNGVVADTPKRIRELETKIKNVDMQTQDLLHLAELETFNAAEGYYIAQRIKETRQKRREYKNELQALSDLRQVMNNNSKFENHMTGLNKALKEVDKHRSYRVKICTDLNKRFDKINQRGVVK